MLLRRPRVTHKSINETITGKPAYAAEADRARNHRPSRDYGHALVGLARDAENNQRDGKLSTKEATRRLALLAFMADRFTSVTAYPDPNPGRSTMRQTVNFDGVALLTREQDNGYSDPEHRVVWYAYGERKLPKGVSATDFATTMEQVATLADARRDSTELWMARGSGQVRDTVDAGVRFRQSGPDPLAMAHRGMTPPDQRAA